MVGTELEGGMADQQQLHLRYYVLVQDALKTTSEAVIGSPAWKYANESPPRFRSLKRSLTRPMVSLISLWHDINGVQD